MTTPRVVSLALLLAASTAAAQTPPTCGANSVAVFEAGCEGPGRLVCSHGVSLPALSTWCGCDGRTVQAPSMSPPAGLRYRHEGACEVSARFELTPERGASGAPTGRVVVSLAVGDVSVELTRTRAPCRDEAAAVGELGRIACGDRAPTRISLRRLGDAVVGVEGTRTHGRMGVPAAQRVVFASTRRF